MLNEIELIIPARNFNLEGFSILRLLPYAQRRTVGPFIFLDHMPKSTVTADHTLQVKPHPHIGLSTLSYLYAGEVLHRDSLGNEVVLKPGDVNWMTAGNGITHSERTPEHLRQREFEFQMLQFWVALPKDHEEMNPAFEHHEASTIPKFKHGDAEVTLVVGGAFGKRSPVNVFSSMFFMDIELPSEKGFSFSNKAQGLAHEMALYVLDGSVKISGKSFNAGSFMVFKAGSALELQALSKTRFVIFGGEPLPEPRKIYWNFVATSEEKIEAAKQRWLEQKFPKVFHDEIEFTPLPPQSASRLPSR